jgi:hypothetical protein
MGNTTEEAPSSHPHAVQACPPHTPPYLLSRPWHLENTAANTCSTLELINGRMVEPSAPPPPTRTTRQPRFRWQPGIVRNTQPHKHINTAVNDKYQTVKPSCTLSISTLHPPNAQTTPFLQPQHDPVTREPPSPPPLHMVLGHTPPHHAHATQGAHTTRSAHHPTTHLRHTPLHHTHATQVHIRHTQRTLHTTTHTHTPHTLQHTHTPHAAHTAHHHTHTPHAVHTPPHTHDATRSAHSTRNASTTPPTHIRHTPRTHHSNMHIRHTQCTTTHPCSGIP